MTEQVYPRFPVIRRFEHWVMVIAFVTLALTGLPQKYPEASVSLWIFKVLGGIEVARIIHHTAAVVLILISLVHIGSEAYDLFVLGKRPSILFSKQDVVNAWQTVLYNLGLRKERPLQGWFTFQEKVEYWALVWGMFVMIVTGFFLWNPILVSTVFPGDWIPAAKIAHGSEAVLAVLAILVWHTYHVHLKHFNKSMFTGVLTREEMEEEHPLVLLQGLEPPRIPEEKRAIRRRWFWVGYGLFALLWLLGTYWFVTAEVTAVSQPPPLPEIVNLQVYQLPTPTPLPPLALPVNAVPAKPTWHEHIAPLLSRRCAYCHPRRHGFHAFDVTSYESTLRGGISGPAVNPGHPAVSPLWFWPQREDHPVHWTPEEAALIWRWIESGVPK